MAKRCRINKVCRGVKAEVGFLEDPIRFVELETPGAIGCCRPCMDAVLESLANANQNGPDGPNWGQNGT